MGIGILNTLKDIASGLKFFGKEITKEEIRQWVREGIEETLADDPINGTIPVDVFLDDYLPKEVIEDALIDESSLAVLRKNNPSATKEDFIGGGCGFQDEDITKNLEIRIPIEVMWRVARKHPVFAKYLAKGVGKHEALHALQFQYLKKKGGDEALRKVHWCMNFTPYFSRPTELTAYAFQYLGVKKDFSKYLDQYLPSSRK